MCKTFNKVKIFYKDVFLETISLDKPYRLDEIKFDNPLIHEYKISIPNVNDFSTISYNIVESYILDLDFCGIKCKTLLSKESLKIIKYLDVLSFISDCDVVDNIIEIKNKHRFVSYAKIIAERSFEILRSLLINLRNKNQLICNFLLRDLIENIKLYLYFIRGAKKEIISKTPQGVFTKEENIDTITAKINQGLKDGDTDWDFNIKQIVKNNKTLGIWLAELKAIEKLNKQCNSYIHKNGLDKISPHYINRSSPTNIKLNDIFLCAKFFFTLIACYDGKVLASSDYIDYLDMGEEPPFDSQYWIAPICQDFIYEEYTKADIEKLKSLTYMDIN
jgi:hypothetical protein